MKISEHISEYIWVNMYTGLHLQSHCIGIDLYTALSLIIPVVFGSAILLRFKVSLTITCLTSIFDTMIVEKHR